MYSHHITLAMLRKMIFASVNMSQHAYLHPASKNEGWSFSSSLGAWRQQAKYTNYSYRAIKTLFKSKKQ